MKNDTLEIFALALKLQGSNTGTRRGRLRRRVFHDTVGPPIVHFFGNMEVPVHREKECHFVLVDLMGSKARYLAPGSGGVVPVLEVL